ncbi:hypothetical protein M0Q28_06960 [Patescibacteria group bacterium]|jgi:hypothetical protein|nr:hypothetical protein [Patescibacteria group bacterium]
MADRNNGFADNFWGTFCRGIRDLLNAFDVSAMALVGILIIFTGAMAWVELLTQGILFTTPEWWVGPSGVLFLVIVTLLGKHSTGFWIASKYNSPEGQPPALPPGAPDPGGTKPAGFATFPALVFLLMLSAVLCAAAFAETYYCVPKDGGYLCKPVDFEHRTFDMAPPGTSARYLPDPYQKPFRCYGKGETYKCLPFDEGAILLETPKTCSEPNRWPNNFIWTN